MGSITACSSPKIRARVSSELSKAYHTPVLYISIPSLPWKILLSPRDATGRREGVIYAEIFCIPVCVLGG